MNLSLLADANSAEPATIDAAIANFASILDDIAKDTPWLTEVSFGGNELWRWLSLIMSVAMALTIGRVIHFLLNRAAKQAENASQKILAVLLTSLGKATAFLMFAVGLPIGTKFLLLNEFSKDVVEKTCGVVMACAVGYAAYQAVAVVEQWLRSFSSRTASRLDDMLAPLVTKMIRATVVVFVFAEIARIVSGMPPTSIVAGLGVGGLAIGLAAQDSIKNIFGSVMIFSDRPFELGDEITVDGNTGIVETVGFRSTRFRTGNGYVITIPNGDLANKAIVNISRRRNLSRTMNLPLPSDLPPQRIEQAIDLVKDILANHEGMLPSMPPKVVFTDITPTSLNLQVQYWFHPADGGRFNALNERVNFEILRRFQAAGITLAVPTQRVELEKAA